MALQTPEEDRQEERGSRLTEIEKPGSLWHLREREIVPVGKAHTEAKFSVDLQTLSELQRLPEPLEDQPRRRPYNV